MKELYKGIYNWKGELHKFTTQAFSIKQAHSNFCRKLSETLKVSFSSIQLYFGKDTNNHHITLMEK